MLLITINDILINVLKLFFFVLIIESAGEDEESIGGDDFATRIAMTTKMLGLHAGGSPTPGGGYHRGNMGHHHNQHVSFDPETALHTPTTNLLDKPDVDKKVKVIKLIYFLLYFNWMRDTRCGMIKTLETVSLFHVVKERTINKNKES